MQRVQVTLIDDLDGVSSAAETVIFGLDGKTYEVDLSVENAARLREALGPWLNVAREVTAPAEAPQPPAEERVDASAVRAWAISQGQQVSERGRLPKGLVREYLDSTQDSTTA